MTCEYCEGHPPGSGHCSRECVVDDYRAEKRRQREKDDK